MRAIVAPKLQEYLNSTLRRRRGAMSSGLVAVFRSIPKELFRVNNGYQIQLRAWSLERRTFDIIVQEGRVQPKALQPSTYEGERAFCRRG